MLDAPEGRPTGPGLAEYSPEREALDRVVDRLGEVIQAVIGASGNKAPKFRPALRPRTAADRLRDRRRREQHEALVARVLPDQ
jgi:hypothetical protein